MLSYHGFDRVAIVGWHEKYSIRIGKMAIGEKWRKARCICVYHAGTGREFKLVIGDSRMTSRPHAMYKNTPAYNRDVWSSRSSDARLDRIIPRDDALPGVAQ